MYRRAERLSNGTMPRWRDALLQLDFGEVVAVLIVLMGLAPFASAGLWAP
jgi:hypothetical protein